MLLAVGGSTWLTEVPLDPKACYIIVSNSFSKPLPLAASFKGADLFHGVKTGSLVYK